MSDKVHNAAVKYAEALIKYAKAAKEAKEATDQFVKTLKQLSDNSETIKDEDLKPFIDLGKYNEPKAQMFTDSGVFPKVPKQVLLPTTIGETRIQNNAKIRCIYDSPGSRHQYPLLQSENCDGTMVALDDEVFKKYADRNRHPIVSNVSEEKPNWFPVMAINTALWFWHPTNPKTMMALVKHPGSNKTGSPPCMLISCNVDTNGFVILLDFHDMGFKGHCTFGNGHHSCDRDGRYVTVHVSEHGIQDEPPTHIFLVDLVSKKIVQDIPSSKGIVTGNRVTSRVSVSGKYLQLNDGTGVRNLYNISPEGLVTDRRQIKAQVSEKKQRAFTDSHSCMLIDENGDDVIVHDWGGAPSFMIRCKDMMFGQLPSTGWGHIGVAAKEGWCVDYSYGGGGTRNVGSIELVPLKWGDENLTGSVPFDIRGSVIMVPPVDRSNVVHVCYHGSSINYLSQPQASQGPSGRVYFTSDAASAKHPREYVAEQDS